jgi:hypothetical protein
MMSRPCLCLLSKATRFPRPNHSDWLYICGIPSPHTRDNIPFNWHSGLTCQSSPHLYADLNGILPHVPNCVQAFPQNVISRWLSKLLEGCFQRRDGSILPPVPTDANNAKFPSLVDCPGVREVCKGKETTFGDELGRYVHLWGQDNWRREYEDCKCLGRGARYVNMEGLRPQCPRELE